MNRMKDLQQIQEFQGFGEFEVCLALQFCRGIRFSTPDGCRSIHTIKNLQDFIQIYRALIKNIFLVIELSMQ